LADQLLPDLTVVLKIGEIQGLQVQSRKRRRTAVAADAVELQGRPMSGCIRRGRFLRSHRCSRQGHRSGQGDADKSRSNLIHSSLPRRNFLMTKSGDEESHATLPYVAVQAENTRKRPKLSIT